MESLGGRGTKTILVRKLRCAILPSGPNESPTSSSSFLDWEGVLISVERGGHVSMMYQQCVRKALDKSPCAKSNKVLWLPRALY